MSFQYIYSSDISHCHRELYFKKNKFFFDCQIQNSLLNYSCSIVGKIIDKENKIGYIEHIIITNPQKSDVIKDFPKKIFVKFNILKNKKLLIKNNYESYDVNSNETKEYDCITQILENCDYSYLTEEDNYDDNSFTQYDKTRVDNLLKNIIDNKEFLSY